MKKILVLLLGVFALVSCDPSEQAYRDLLSFTEDLEKNGATYTQEDWEKASFEYETIEQNMSKLSFTDEQLREIGKLKGRCAVQLTKYSIKKTQQDLSNFLLEAEGFMQSITEELDNVSSEVNQ